MNTKNALLAATTLTTLLGCQEPPVEIPYGQGHVEIYDHCNPSRNDAQRHLMVIVRDGDGRLTLVIKDTECDGNLLQNHISTFADGDTIQPLRTRDEIRVATYEGTRFVTSTYGRNDFRHTTKGDGKSTILRVQDNLLPCVREELQADMDAQFAKAQTIYEEILSQYQLKTNAQ